MAYAITSSNDTNILCNINGNNTDPKCCFNRAYNNKIIIIITYINV